MPKSGSLRQRDFLHVLEGGKSAPKPSAGKPSPKSKTGKGRTKAGKTPKARRPRRAGRLWGWLGGGCRRAGRGLAAWSGRRLRGLRRLAASKPLRRRLAGSRNYLILLGFIVFAGLLAVGSHRLIQARVEDSVARVAALGAAIEAGKAGQPDARALDNPWSHEPIRVRGRVIELAGVNGPGCAAIARRTLGRFRSVAINGRLLPGPDEARLRCANEDNTLRFVVGP